MKKINLSYVLVTKNKLPYLTLVLSDLIKNRKSDEEIIVVDGLSTDGTKKYVQPLFKKGKIQNFVSESDLGESHATNKAIMLAKGEIIKIITDDDAFYYPAISTCKEYLLAHKDIEVLATNGSCVSWKSPDPLPPTEFEIDYQVWIKDKRPFNFTGLGLFLRKNAIAKIGLLDTNTVRSDFEYSLRLTSGKPNLAWFTGACWVRILNPSSNSFKRFYITSLEGIKLEQMYLNKNAFIRIIILKIQNIGALLLNSYIKGKLIKFNFKKTYDVSQNWLETRNTKYPGTFLFEKREFK